MSNRRPQRTPEEIEEVLYGKPTPTPTPTPTPDEAAEVVDKISDKDLSLSNKILQWLEMVGDTVAQRIVQEVINDPENAVQTLKTMGLKVQATVLSCLVACAVWAHRTGGVMGLLRELWTLIYHRAGRHRDRQHGNQQLLEQYAVSGRKVPKGKERKWGGYPESEIFKRKAGWTHRHSRPYNFVPGQDDDMD